MIHYYPLSTMVVCDEDCVQYTHRKAYINTSCAWRLTALIHHGVNVEILLTNLLDKIAIGGYNYAK